MIGGSIRIATIFGIDIRVHVSWILIAVLIFFDLQDLLAPIFGRRVLALYAVAALGAFLFFASLLLHELSHSLVARRLGLPVHSITLFLFGGVSNLRREPESARSEFLMAIVGPLTSLLLAGAFALGSSDEAQRYLPGWLVILSAQLAFVNLLLALFNLLPGFPLDGGRVFRSILWAIRGERRWATQVASRGGVVVAGLLALYGGWNVIEPGTQPYPLGQFGGLWLILIAYFLFNAATASYRQEVYDDSLRRVSVASLMTRDLASVPPDLAVSALVQMYVLPMRGRAFPVQDDSRFLGVVSVGDVRRVPQAEWPTRRVGDVMTPVARLDALAPTDDAHRGLERLMRSEAAQLPVMEDGRVVGLFERDVVLDYLRMRDELGVDRRKR